MNDNKTLDPSKVKAGDTVTLTRESEGLAKVEGTVAEVRYDGSTDTVWLLIRNITQYVFWLNEWTLTAHQPAPKKTPREQVVDILIDYSNNRADDYDTADRIIDALVQDETRPLPTREQIADLASSWPSAWALTDRIEALLRGDSSSDPAPGKTSAWLDSLPDGTWVSDAAGRFWHKRENSLYQWDSPNQHMSSLALVQFGPFQVEDGES